MIRQPVNRRFRRHRASSSRVHRGKTASVGALRRDVQRAAGNALLLLPLLLPAAAGCHPPRPIATYSLTVSGAQIPADLVAAWLAETDDPHFVVERVWPMRSAHDGFTHLAAGRCELAVTDRRLTERELPAFGTQPVAGRRVGFYGYALYVHPDNPLDALYAGHLELILQKRITDWSALASDPIPNFAGPIRVYGLAKSTRAGMQLSYLARIWFDHPTWTVLDSDAAVIEQVAQDPRALGFAHVGFDGPTARYLGLRMERTGPAALPSLEEIESERYGLAKVIYAYFRAPPAPAVQAALDYLQSPAAAADLAESDVWPVAPDRAALPPVP